MNESISEVGAPMILPVIG